MKGRVLILDKWKDREAAVLVVDGQLQELSIDPLGDAPLPGAIYRAVADRPLKGQGGGFVKLPDGMSGFLRQTGGIAPGQRILVQVNGTAETGKALPVTTRLAIKGRFALLTPGAPGLNISRLIRDEERRAALSQLATGGMTGAPADLGLIMRSACGAAEDDEIAGELGDLVQMTLALLADLQGPPELLLDGPSAHELAWRDWLDPEPDEVIEAEGGFADSNVIEMLQTLSTPRSALPGGGHVMIEPTRALTAIDVNTGADTSPAASLKANIAAARDLPRQLRLRGLGGQIVIDFAPVPKKDRAILDQVLRAAFKSEAEVHLAGWTNLGLYELTRKRDRLPLSELL
jgi:ribonuclease G